jgi:hypothetical protein
MRLTIGLIRRLIAEETLRQISPAWREDPKRRFDVEATPVGHGHYGALNPDKRKPSEVEAAVDERVEEEFMKYAVSEFGRIFKTDFYEKKLADSKGQFDFVADDTITRALSGDIMHGLLHEMIQKYIFEIFKEKRQDQPEYDIWANIMETIVYYLQNGVSGTNPAPFGRFIAERMSETIDLPESLPGDKLYSLFMNVFTSGTHDRPGHNQIEEIPAKLRKPFLRNIQKALKGKPNVKPREAFTQAISYFINDMHKGGNAVNFLYDADGNDISDQVMTFYNSLKRKVELLKKKYPSRNESRNLGSNKLLVEFIKRAIFAESGKKDSRHPSQYGAPQGSKRDKQLDMTKADLESGDPKRVQRAYNRRERMEKAEREKSGWKNKPRPDSKNEAHDVLRLNEEILTEMVLEALSKKTKATLRKKAEKRGLTPGSVEAEYKKGLAAWATSGSRKGMSQHQWAMARVNSANPSKDWAVVKKSKSKK